MSGTRHRQQHLRRRGLLRVGVRDRPFEQIVELRVTRLVGVGHHLDAIHDTPRPHLEHLHHGTAGPELHADGIAVAHARRRHLLLPVAQRLEGPDRVADLTRLFVAFLISRRLHARLEVGDEFLGAAIEEQPSVPDGVLVLGLAADRGDAWGQASLDVVLEAGAAPLPRDHFAA